MGPAVLVEREIELAQQALAAFDKARLNVRACFWLLFPKSGIYRLVVASPIVDRKGLIYIYDRIQKLLEDEHLSGKLPLDWIRAMGLKDPIVHAFRSTYGRLAAAPPLRVTDSYVDGEHVDDAVVLRLK